jgi:hypothetical protein
VAHATRPVFWRATWQGAQYRGVGSTRPALAEAGYAGFDHVDRRSRASWPTGLPTLENMLRAAQARKPPRCCASPVRRRPTSASVPGYVRNRDHPEIQAAIRDIVRRARRLGARLPRRRDPWPT